MYHTICECQVPFGRFMNVLTALLSFRPFRTFRGHGMPVVDPYVTPGSSPVDSRVSSLGRQANLTHDNLTLANLFHSLRVNSDLLNHMIHVNVCILALK